MNSILGDFKVRKSIARFGANVVVTLLLMTLVSTQGFAKSRMPIEEVLRKTNPRFTRVMGYDQLVRLSPAKRAAYVAGVRAMVVEISKIQNSNPGLYSQQEHDRVRAYATFLTAFISEADALEKKVNRVDPTKAVRGILFTPTGQSEQICTDDGVMTFQKTTLNVQRKSGEAKYTICALSSSKATDGICPMRTIPVAQDDVGGFECASVGTFYTLPKDVQTSLTLPNPAASAEAQTAFLFVEGIGPAELYPKGMKPPEMKGSTATTPPKATTPAKKTEEKADDDVAVTGPVSVAAAEPSECSLPEKLPATCNAGTIKAARKDYYALKKNECLNGGNFVSYANGKPEPGKCSGVNEYCPSNPGCKTSNGEEVAKLLTCANDETETLCNPLIFGLNKAGGAFCGKQGDGATESCDKLSTAKTRQSGEFLLTNDPGIRESWNDFANHFNELCHGKASADFFCRECYVIKRRLIAMNVATNDSDMCNYAMLFAPLAAPASTVPATPASPTIE